MRARPYETCVPDLLDISVLDQISRVAWTHVAACADLGCGTGRTAEWLRAQGVATIDGIDLTPEMLAQAKDRGLHRSLVMAPVDATGLGNASYDLAVMCLVDEHLADLAPAYREAARIVKPGGQYVVVGMHPFFFMHGMPTHYDTPDGQSKAIETHVHLFRDHFAAARAAGWTLEEVVECVIDDAWVAVKPKWDALRGRPVNYGYVWRAASPSDAL